MTRDLDAVLASIDGALADEAMPDGMRWSPAPEKVTDAAVNLYDGECVPIPPQAYERARRPPDEWLSPLAGPRVTVSPPRSNHASGLAMDRPAPARWVDVGSTDYRPEVLLVEEHGPGTVTGRRATAEDFAHVTVRRATAEDIAHLFEPAIAAAVDAFRPFAAAVMEAARAFDEASRSLVPAPPAAWTATATEEQRRDAALAHRRALGSGPPRPGPEQSHAPRRLAR